MRQTSGCVSTLIICNARHASKRSSHRSPPRLISLEAGDAGGLLPVPRVILCSFGSLDRSNKAIHKVVALWVSENLAELPCGLLYRQTSVAQETDARGAAERCVRDKGDTTIVSCSGLFRSKHFGSANMRQQRIRCPYVQRQRKKVEALFAELKNQIGLRRLRLRKLKFVREQFFLAATAQNLKRLVRFLSQPKRPVLVTA